MEVSVRELCNSTCKLKGTAVVTGTESGPGSMMSCGLCDHRFHMGCIGLTETGSAKKKGAFGAGAGAASYAFRGMYFCPECMDVFREMHKLFKQARQREKQLASIEALLSALQTEHALLKERMEKLSGEAVVEQARVAALEVAHALLQSENASLRQRVAELTKAAAGSLNDGLAAGAVSAVGEGLDKFIKSELVEVPAGALHGALQHHQQQQQQQQQHHQQQQQHHHHLTNGIVDYNHHAPVAPLGQLMDVTQTALLAKPSAIILPQSDASPWTTLEPSCLGSLNTQAFNSFNDFEMDKFQVKVEADLQPEPGDIQGTNTELPKDSLPTDQQNMIEDDQYLYCDECQEKYLEDCPIHGPMKIMPDTEVAEDDMFKADNSVPAGLTINQSAEKGDGRGVWATELIPKGVVFGPYKGEITYNSQEAQKSDYCWHIVQKWKASYSIDGRDLSKSNWMRYVNSASQEQQQNLTSFQYKGQIFYRTLTEIAPGTELLVWYGELYADVGMDTDSTSATVKRESYAGEVFACDQCEDIFTSKELMETHRQRHRDATGGKKHKCGQCNYSTNASMQFQSHLRTHTGERPYHCETCGKSFSTSSILRNHARTHSGEFPYACKVCGRRFNVTSSLKRHERIHSKEKPFVCGACGVAFTDAYTLKSHEQRTHSALKLHQCDYCQERFACKEYLTYHVIRKHTKQYPHSCEQCGKGFLHPNLKRKHIGKCHPQGGASATTAVVTPSPSPIASPPIVTAAPVVATVATTTAAASVVSPPVMLPQPAVLVAPSVMLTDDAAPVLVSGP